MQKNKSVHEDIKAVCNSATKKLVAIGLVAAVGGTCTMGCDNRLLASAQSESPAGEQGESPASEQGGSPAREQKGAQNKHTELQERRKDPCWNFNLVKCILLDHDVTAATFDDYINPEKLEKEIALLKTRKIDSKTIDCFKALMAPHVQRVYNNRKLDHDYFVARNDANRLLYEAGYQGTWWSADSRVLPSAMVGGHGEIFENLAERIRINEESLSNEFIEEFLSLRTADLNRFRRVTTPGSTIILQNGTGLTMGATVQETAENILRALTPNSLRNVLDRVTNPNGTDDEMKEERENHSTTSSQGGGVFSMLNSFNSLGGWSGGK